jgi:uncharacterized protein (TIGR03435 family)
MSVRAVIRFAYDLRGFQLPIGPGWITSERFDIVAKRERNPAATTEARQKVSEEGKEMVRALLADRFGLAVHHETKEQQVYLLSVARTGPKMKVATAPGNQPGTGTDPGRIRGSSATIAMFVTALSNEMGLQIFDKTGLTGSYDFVLEWTPDAEPGAPDSLGPTIFTALQEQLGLRLDSAKGPVDTIVIDRIERPSAN